MELDFLKIYNEANQIENPEKLELPNEGSENSASNVEATETPEKPETTEKKPLEENSDKAQKDRWDTVKNNIASIDREYASIMRNPSYERLQRGHSFLCKDLQILGSSIVGMSSVLGGLLKLGNAIIPGFDIFSAPLGMALGGVRVAGQGLVNKGSPLKPVGRIAPSQKVEEK